MVVKESDNTLLYLATLIIDSDTVKLLVNLSMYLITLLSDSVMFKLAANLLFNPKLNLPETTSIESSLDVIKLKYSR